MVRQIKEVTVAARIEEDLRDDIAKLAHEADRSFSAEIRRALRWYVIAHPTLKGER